MKQFILVWLYGGKVAIIIYGDAQLCQLYRTRLKSQPQYSKGKLLVRTLAGFKANPFWQGKLKK